MTRLYFIRHGESESNIEARFTGQLDIPLSEKGLQQARLTAEHLKEAPISAVYASDLSRAYETGCIIADKHGLTAIPTPHLREIDGGEWQGKPYAELENLFPDSYGLWKKQIGLASAPKGETVAHLQQRVLAFVEAVVRVHPDEHVAIVTHATPIRAMECVWSDTPLSLMHTVSWVSNASVTVVDYAESGSASVSARDFHAHLAELHTELPKTV